jgi:hypothetical protein
MATSGCLRLELARIPIGFETFPYTPIVSLILSMVLDECRSPQGMFTMTVTSHHKVRSVHGKIARFGANLIRKNLCKMGIYA